MWRDYRDAPAAGTLLCALADVPAGGVKTLMLGAFPLLLVHLPQGVRAYVNACPHQYLPLDYHGSSLLSADGTLLRCSVHQAGFDALTGEGREGFGENCALDAVPVRVENGHIIVS